MSVLRFLAVLTLSWGFIPVNCTKGQDCPCPVLERPDLWKKELTARWMMHTLNWGVLSTISSRLPDGPPFGNVYSFVDGSCGNSTGTPYFYGTFMDQTFKDMKVNAKASFTLSEAGLASVCGIGSLDACSLAVSSVGHHVHVGDPESPICARLTVTGTLVQVESGTDEFNSVQAAFFHRHPQMADWPLDHNWVVAKLEIEDIWLIDYFGGASILNIDKYFAQKLAHLEEEEGN